MEMDVNAGEREFWSGKVGEVWVAFEDELEGYHSVFNTPLLEAADLAPGQRVLDIGCGTGAVSRLAAQSVGQNGAVTGLDISSTMLDGARALSTTANGAPVTYLEADAQTHGFAPAAFDRIISRMGVMFFADPVAAFANILKAASPDACFAAICWRRGMDAPWFTLSRKALSAVLGPPDEMPHPHAPGPMAFADEDRVIALLSAAGWIEAEVQKTPLSIRVEGGPMDLANVMARVGPAAREIRQGGHSQEVIDAIFAAIAEQFSPFDKGGHLEVPVVMNLFTARAPG